MINWYELPDKTALGLILIIARSCNVIKITAGKLFQLSIATFGDVSNTYIIFIMNCINKKRIYAVFTLHYKLLQRSYTVPSLNLSSRTDFE